MKAKELAEILLKYPESLVLIDIEERNWYDTLEGVRVADDTVHLKNY